MNSEITDRFHRENQATAISQQFLMPANVNTLIRQMEKEATIRKENYIGRYSRALAHTSYSIEDVYPLFESFVKKSFQPRTDLNHAFLSQHVQMFIASDVQHMRYAIDVHDRKQLSEGFVRGVQLRRRAAHHPVQRPEVVRRQKVKRINFMTNIVTKDRRDAAMREAGLK